MPIELLLSVWPVTQRTGCAQRLRRYLEISGTHPAKMLPAIAAQAVATYTQPGDITLDPMCGVGTPLVEAVHQGSDAMGIEYEPDWADYAQANLALATSQGSSGHGEVICGDGRSLASLIDPAVRSLVALVLTSPPYGPSLHGRVSVVPGDGVRKTHDRYSTEPANLAHIGLAGLLDAVRTPLRGAAQVLWPDGVVSMTVRPWWRDGQLIDIPGALAWVGEEAGLVLYERNVALLAALRDDTLVPRALFFALEQVRKACAAGLPRLVTAHEDLLVWRLRRAPGTGGR